MYSQMQQNVLDKRQTSSIFFVSFLLATLILSCNEPAKEQEVINENSLANLNKGKILFEKNCSSCHGVNKTLVAPPFQRIRDANGLDWSISWVKGGQKLIKQRDTNALYIFYAWNMLVQPDFPNLSNKEIESIFDYVDSYPFDSTTYAFRMNSKLERWNQVDSIDRARKYRWDLMNDTLPHNGTATKKKVRKAKNWCDRPPKPFLTPTCCHLDAELPLI